MAAALLVLSIKDLLLLLVLERCPARHEFVDEAPERPVVHSLAVALGLDDFGRKVLGRTAQRPRPRRHVPALERGTGNEGAR